jgi:hypothetical protein
LPFSRDQVVFDPDQQQEGIVFQASGPDASTGWLLMAGRWVAAILGLCQRSR